MIRDIMWEDVTQGGRMRIGSSSAICREPAHGVRERVQSKTAVETQEGWNLQDPKIVDAFAEARFKPLQMGRMSAIIVVVTMMVVVVMMMTVMMMMLLMMMMLMSIVFQTLNSSHLNLLVAQILINICSMLPRRHKTTQKRTANTIASKTPSRINQLYSASSYPINSKV